MKKIENKLSSFNKYYDVILILIKLIPVLKNNYFIMRNMLNIKEFILFKIIMQKIILSCMRKGNDNSNNQYKSYKFFNTQFNRNYQSNKVYHFNKFKKNNKLNNCFNSQTSNKFTHTKMKNRRNNCCFKYYKQRHYHRDCSKKNK